MSTEVNTLGFPTLLDVVNSYTSQDASGKYLKAVRILDRICPLIRYMPMVAANSILSNTAMRQDSLPTPGTRRFNTGVQPTSSKNTPISDPMALFEAYSEVDKELWLIQNDPNMWRQDQDMNHVEGFKQALESWLMYGNLAQDPGGFNGLATRFNKLGLYPNGDISWMPNVWDGGATSGPVTSAWFLELGPGKVYGIYPPNTPAGLKIEDLGESTKETPEATGGGPIRNFLYQVLRTHLTWRLGLQVADERCAQRVANVNPTVLSSNNFDENTFIEALNYLPGGGEAPGTVILVNRALLTQIDIRAVNQKLNVTTSFSTGNPDVFGRKVTMFRGIPVLMSDKILNTETVVS